MGRCDRQGEQMKVSITIPVYNEAEIIKKIISEIDAKVVKKGNFEFIVVEDGSNDGTKEVLKKIGKKYNLLLFMDNERRGYHGALKYALTIPKGDVIFFSDSDGQHDPANFWDLYKYVDDYDIISGFRIIRTDPFHRIILSRIYNFSLLPLFSTFFRDSNCGFKIIKKRVIDDVLGDVKYIKFGFSTEFLVLAKKRGYKILEVPVTHRKRTTGRATQFEIRRLPKAIVAQILGMISLKRFLVSSRKYRG